MNATPDDPDGHQSDADQTAKDRSYSPASERETEVKQQDSTGDTVRPGTGPMTWATCPSLPRTISTRRPSSRAATSGRSRAYSTRSPRRFTLAA